MNLIEQISEPPSIFSKYGSEPTRVPVGTAGKEGIAYLTFDRFGEKTYLTENFNRLPAKILGALYYDQYNPGIPYILFSNPTGGIVQGDRYTYRFTLNAGAEAFITDITATKLYRMDLNYASRNTDIFLYDGARLEFLPRENIAFKGSRWLQRTVVHLKGNATFLYSEVFVPGRVAMGEFWDFDVFSTKFIVERDNRVLLMDASTFYGSDKGVCDVLFAGKKYLLNAYWFSSNASKEGLVLDGVIEGFSSMPYGNGLVIRALSDDLDQLKKFQLNIWKNFRMRETNKEVPFLRMY